MGDYLTDFIKYYFLDERGDDLKWIQWKTFLWGAGAILIIMPITFYLLKKLYNCLQKLIKFVKIFFNCLKGENER